MRKLFYAIILLFAVYFVFTHLEELQLVFDVISQGNLLWLLAAVVMQWIWLVNIAAAFQSTYWLVGVREHLGRMIPLTTAANFVNVVAPSYGLGAMAVLIADGRQRGKPVAKVSTAAVLYLVYDYLGFMIVLSIGLIILYRSGVFDTVLIAASIFTISIALVLFALTILGINSSQKLGQVVLSLIGLANRILHPFLRRNAFSTQRAQAFASDISDGLQNIRRSPGRVLLPGLLALSRKAVLMAILFLVSMAFKHPFSLRVLVAGFTTSYLFTIASITPSGVGFVEGAMTVYISAMGVDLATSAVIALAYRGITFWLTLAYGTVAIRWVGYRHERLPPERSGVGDQMVSARTWPLKDSNPLHNPHSEQPPQAAREDEAVDRSSTLTS
jgi:uncharacterized protein (TIRG00374 family)